MKFSNNVLLTWVFLLICFTVNSYAAITSILSELTEAEKLLTSKNYQAIQEALIMNSFDKDSIASKAAIEKIRKEALRLEGTVDVKEALYPVIESILGGVRMISYVERVAYDTFDKAMNLAVENPMAAIKSIQNSIKKMFDLTLTYGVPIEEAFGSAVAKSGGTKHNEVKKCLTYTQSAGTSFLEALKIGGEIAMMGIEAGGGAAKVGIKAAREAISSGVISSCKAHIEGAKYIIDSYLNSASSPNSMMEAYSVQGIIDSFKTNVTTKDPAALAAIDDLNSYKKSLMELKSQSARDASNILIEALSSAISEGADAMTIAKNSFKRIKQLAIEDKQAAFNAAQKIIQEARDELIHSASIAFLSYGAAKEVTNGLFSGDELIGAMVEIIMARVSCYDVFKYSEQIILMAIQSGDIDQGVVAASAICEAAGNILYKEYQEGGVIGLKFLQSIQ